MAEVVLLDSATPVFPAPNSALRDPDGLLAVGGNLSTETIISAYSQGIFPWYEDGQPLLWWSPDPRAVIIPGQLAISRSLRKALRQDPWRVTTDQNFEAVIRHCAAPREYADGTWITREMIDSYRDLHIKGYAHSIEVWLEDKLVGGLYGLTIGAVFCGESMFSDVSNASKVAMVYLDALCQQFDFQLIDCQVPNDHLQSLGAQSLSRELFLGLLSQYRNKKCHWPDSLDSITV